MKRKTRPFHLWYTLHIDAIRIVYGKHPADSSCSQMIVVAVAAAACFFSFTMNSLEFFFIYNCRSISKRSVSLVKSNVSGLRSLKAYEFLVSVSCTERMKQMKPTNKKKQHETTYFHKIVKRI